MVSEMKKNCAKCGVVIHPKYKHCRDCYMESITPTPYYEVNGEQAQAQIDDGLVEDALREMGLEDEEFYSPNVGCK